MSETPRYDRALFFPFMAGFYDGASRLAYPLIRLFTGLILMPHGAQKLFGWFGGSGLVATGEGFAKGLGGSSPACSLPSWSAGRSSSAAFASPSACSPASPPPAPSSSWRWPSSRSISATASS